MRSNQNPQGSNNRGVAAKLSLAAMPVEWLDAGSWRLPSGKVSGRICFAGRFSSAAAVRGRKRSEKRSGREPGSGGSLKRSRFVRSPRWIS